MSETHQSCSVPYRCCVINGTQRTGYFENWSRQKLNTKYIFVICPIQRGKKSFRSWEVGFFAFKEKIFHMLVSKIRSSGQKKLSLHPTQ